MTQNNTKTNVLPGMQAYLPPPDAPPDWPVDRLSVEQIARAFAVTVQAVYAWLRAGCPHAKEGARHRLALPAVIAWRRERDLAKVRLADDALDLPDDAPSDALERLRTIKADREHLRLQIERGQLIDRREVESSNRRVFNALRQNFEAVERTHGPAVGDAIRAAIDAAERDLDAATPAQPEPMQ